MKLVLQENTVFIFITVCIARAAQEWSRDTLAHYQLIYSRAHRLSNIVTITPRENYIRH